MPINQQPIKPVSGVTSGAGTATTINLLVERSNGSVVLINKNEAGIGDLTKLKSDDKSSLVNAFNELTGRLENGDLIADYVGLLRDLNTNVKTNIVAAINEVNNNVGPISLLETVENTNIVSSINYLNEIVGQLGDIGNGDFDNIIDAINSKVAKVGDTMTGTLKFSKDTVNSQIEIGLADEASITGNSLGIRTNKGFGLGPLITGGSIPVTEFSHVFDTTDGSARFRGVLTIDKDIEARSDVYISGTRLAFRSTTGSQLGSVEGSSNGDITVKTTSSPASSFVFKGSQLEIVAAPTGVASVTNKKYVDDLVQALDTASDAAYFKKTGGTVNGNVNATGVVSAGGGVEANGAITIKQAATNGAPYLWFARASDSAELGIVYYDPTTNTVRVRLNKINNQEKNFSFGNDGNIETINSTVPTKDTHLAPKKYVDDRIAFVRDRSNQLGTQTMSTISDAGALATKNKVAVADMETTGTPSSTSVLFGDGVWRESALDASSFIKNNITTTQNMTGSLSIGNGAMTVIAPASANAHYWMRDENGLSRGLFHWQRTDNSVHVRLYLEDGTYKNVAIRETGNVEFPGGQKLNGNGTTYSPGNLSVGASAIVETNGNLWGTAWTGGNLVLHLNSTAMRAYPRRSDGGAINFLWSGQSGQPTWLWGGTDGTNMYVYNPANFNVNAVGGWTQATIFNQIEDRAYNRTGEFIANSGAGGWATYAMLARWDGGAGGGAANPGDQVAGSGLRWANANGIYGGAPGGSWRCMGYSISSGRQDDKVTLWMRYG